MPSAAAPGSTLLGTLRFAEQQLAAAGIDNPPLDARLLTAAALGLKPDALRTAPDRALAPEDEGRVEALVARRIEAREPVSRILGRREFWSLEFRITPDVLDPRPDSETLVETALAMFPNRTAPLRVLDLGTGSGCLLLAVLLERPSATGLGIDAGEAALAVAAGNAARLGFADRARFQRGDWGRGLEERFDLILCNPPYIAEADRATLAPEVAQHDPPGALFAGPDGLGAYRAILPDVPRLLAPEGRALFEIGATQAAPVAMIAQTAGLAVIEVKPDLAGRDRCIVMSAT